ncbi:gliding motility-associated C-terminal domain-containing protein [Flavobacterium sp. N1994]|uniref:gliding motility-associated C-terminal domain-containing protein n=1 Tax=Flavobacterium sp. N1994 TaxID=2986827 RepID=UPI002223A09F|nr:gliding motility-associated C-terminal domain-containing protein [Flavobacterium sp. N1994]
MKSYRVLWIFIILLSPFPKLFGQTQNVIFYQQFNGRYDFTFIGNTLNVTPNGAFDPCLVLPNSSATLNLNTNDVIEKAYLYWAGSGTGDFDVKLNGTDIAAQRTFSATQNSNGHPFFSAFADVTTFVQTTGNSLYTLSDLDVSPFLDASTYCDNGTNFSGWAIVIVFKNSNLPLNQLNIYDGLEALQTAIINVQDSLVINLPSLNVLDAAGAKIGFVAWEGDASIHNQESLSINGHILSNPPLNPSDNIFNGTNSITGDNTLYNMDLDIFDIQNNIHVGDTSASISMTTAQDFVLINAIVTKLNSQLPDATIAINAVDKQCDSKTIVVHYTVANLNCTNPLPALTPISIYINGVLFQTLLTPVEIPIDGTISDQITLVLPNAISTNFEIKLVVDDAGNGTGIVTELVENNNVSITNETLLLSPTINPLQNLQVCNEGFTKGTFDFSSYEDLVKTNPGDAVYFYETLEDANNNVNPILNSTNYVALTTPKEIFVRVNNANCFATTSFLVTTRNCPPTVYNFVSANNDTLNDVFFIAGLRDIFLNFELEIYSRWGRLIWTGNQNTEDWNGYVKDGIGTKNAPDGTYFYLLFLNDIDYPEPLKGFLYLNH